MPAVKKTPRATRAAPKPAAKPAVKRAAKPVAKPRAATKASAAPADKKPKAPKHAKSHDKPVRDSFTMPQADFALIALLKERALAERREAKKSELLRAGLHALAALDAAALVAALGRLQPIKVGRPSKHH
jgi:hypothetical protein